MDEKLRAWTNGPERAHATHDDHVPVLEASTWMFVPLVPLPTAEVSVWNRTVGRHRPAHLRHLGQLSKVSYLFRYMVLPRPMVQTGYGSCVALRSSCVGGVCCADACDVCC